MNHDSRTKPFLWDNLFSWIYKKAVKYKIPFVTSMIVGFLAYTFIFTNKFINHDEVTCLFSKGGTIVLGRWFLGLVDAIFPNLSMPWIYGVLTIVFVSVSTCLIISIFQIRNKTLQGILAGCIVVFPSLIGTFGYMFTASSYGLSLFLAVLAAWMISRYNKWLFLPAMACLVLSLAIYQGYVALAASLLVLLEVQLLLNGDPIPAVIRKGVVSLVFLIGSLGIYYLSTKVVNWYLGIGFSGYATERVAFSLSDLPSNVFLAYSRFWESLVDNPYGLIPTAFSRVLHWVALACSAGLLVLWFLGQKKADWGRYLLMAAMLLLLPLAINCLFLFTDASAVHTLTLYSFVAVYVLAIMLADIYLEETGLNSFRAAVSSLCIHLIPLCLAIVIVINVYIANAAGLQFHLRYEIAYSFYTSLMADVKMMPEFDEDSKLAVVGFYDGPEYYYTSFAPLNKIMGLYGFTPSDYSKDRFLQYYLNYNIPFASEEEIAQIQQTPEFRQMPLYPYYGSMQWFGDTLVVKLAEQ